jgi:hypothetical protein
MREMPKVEVHIVQSTERPSGIGENEPHTERHVL